MYIAIVKQTGGFVEKHQVFPDEAQADAHVLTHGGFVALEPVGGYHLKYCTVDPIAKTIVYDSATHTADSKMKVWKYDMGKSDNELMPRWAEDIYDVLPQAQKDALPSNFTSNVAQK